MQKLIISMMIISFLLSATDAKCTDTSKTLRNRIFKTIISTDKQVKGYLENITDSSVLVSSRSVKFNPLAHELGSANDNISYRDIKKIEIRRKGSGGRGALIGGLSAMAAGVLTGLIAGDDKILPPSEDPWRVSEIFASSAGDKAVALGLLGLVSGGIIGAVIGAISSKKYTINGNKDKYNDMREKILNKAYRSNQHSY